MPNYCKIQELCREMPDDARYFPGKVFERLKREGLLQKGLPSRFTDQANTGGIINSLFEIGKADLSVGRIYEGHINAIKLLEDYGTSSQQEFYFREVQNGKLFSVWNTERSFEAVSLEKGKKGLYLKGAKTFCSGALEIDYALITARYGKNKQLLVIPVKGQEQLKPDWSLWRPMGMKNSVSCRIDFTGLAVSKEDFLGKPNIYEEEPWFTGGALRFAAVQLGGAQAIMDATVEHLIKLERQDDPYQQERMGQMTVCLQTGKLWLERAESIYQDSSGLTKEEIVHFANMMRTAILEISEKVLQLAERSVGVQGFMEGHPLERRYRDLKVYLKQPGPDMALQNVGKHSFKNFLQ